MDKMKISPKQLFWLILCLEIPGMELLLIRPLIESAHQDAWISLLVGGVYGIAIACLMIFLSRLFRHQTIIEITQTIFGKWFGKFAAFPYLVMWIIGLGVMLRQFGDFIHLSLLLVTPMWAILLSFVGVTVYLVRAGGIEGIARCGELAGPAIMLMILFIKLLNIPNIELNLISPVYVDTGWGNIAFSSISTEIFFGESVVLLVLMPFVSEQERATPYILWAQVIVTVFVSTTCLLVVTVFGAVIPFRMLYPAFELAGFISISDFIQNIESLAAAVWTFGYFVGISLMMFITSYSLGQWFELKNWHGPILPVAIIAGTIALLPENLNFASVYVLQNKWLILGNGLTTILIPVLLLVISLMQKKYARRFFK